MAHEVFISYSTRDSTVAERVYAALTQAGLGCWMASHDIAPGQAWDDAIMAALPASRVVLLLLSSHANASHQVHKEIEIADNRRIPVLPLRLEDIRPTGGLELHLSRPQWLDAFNPPFEPVLDRVAVAVRRLLTAPASAVPRVAPEHNLPAPPNALIGREGDVAAVADLLLRDDVRLVTLTGPGGVGKTRLALQVAINLLPHFLDGTTFVDLAPLTDPALVVPTIATALGVRESAGQTPIEALKTVLQAQQRLLWLDNFEHLLAAAPVVADLLAACPQLHVLATSRERLNVSGEAEFAVAPLDVPSAHISTDLAALAQVPAVALFVERARAVKRDFTLTDSLAPAVAAICQRLDGLPLAIELAAARVKLLPPPALLPRLTNRLQILTGGARNLPPRQQTLRATIAWSYDLLTPEEQHLFRQLAVFAGGATIEAIEAVANPDGVLDVLSCLGSLVEKSLLRQQAAPAEAEAADSEDLRFGLLETIREFAWEQFTGQGEVAGARERHASFFARLLDEAAPKLQSTEPAIWLGRLDAEYGNLREVLRLACEEATWRQIGLQVARHLAWFWLMRGHLSEGWNWLALLLHSSPEANPTLRAEALNGAGRLAHAQGEFRRAQACFDECLVIRRSLGDHIGIAAAMNNLGAVAHLQGDVDRARAFYEDSLTFYRQIGDQRGMAASLGNLAVLATELRDINRGRPLFEECLSMYRQLDDQHGIALVLNNLGNMAQVQKDYTQARTFYEQSLRVSRRLGDQLGIARTLTSLGNAAKEQNDYAQARTFYEESLVLNRRLGDQLGITTNLEAFASIWAAHGEAARAVRIFGAAEALRGAIGAPFPLQDRASQEQALALLQEHLGEGCFDTARAVGGSMLLEEAIAEALADTPRSEEPPTPPVRP